MPAERDVAVAAWTRRCGIAAIVAALPTVVWRVVVGAGATLGTPGTWRRREALPGSGTGYVVGLSVVQLIAALLTLVLVVPGLDRVPRWSPVAPGRRYPRALVVIVSLLGAAVLAFLCGASALNWDRVDPFGDARVDTGWTYLCWACYAAAVAWPPLLVATVLGYRRSRGAEDDAAPGR